MGLSEGALGRDGREGLIWGGPGNCSSITWVKQFSTLQIEEIQMIIYFFAHKSYLHVCNSLKWPLSTIRFQLTQVLWKETYNLFQICELIIKHSGSIPRNRGMHVSPAKHSYACLPRKCDYRTDRQTDRMTDRQMPDKVIPMCRYTSQATQKRKLIFFNHIPLSLLWRKQCILLKLSYKISIF